MKAEEAVVAISDVYGEADVKHNLIYLKFLVDPFLTPRCLSTPWIIPSTTLGTPNLDAAFVYLSILIWNNLVTWTDGSVSSSFDKEDYGNFSNSSPSDTKFAIFSCTSPVDLNFSAKIYATQQVFNWY